MPVNHDEVVSYRHYAELTKQRIAHARQLVGRGGLTQLCMQGEFKRCSLIKNYSSLPQDSQELRNAVH